MTLLEQEHQIAARERIAALVADAEAHTTARYYRRRHAVRVAMTIACFAVLVYGIFHWAFSG
jgi:hypothetical protein